MRTLLSKICDSVLAANSAAIMVGITLTNQNASTSLRWTLQREMAKGRAFWRVLVIIRFRLSQQPWQGRNDPVE